MPHPLPLQAFGLLQACLYHKIRRKDKGYRRKWWPKNL